MGIMSKTYSNCALDGAIRYFMWVHMSTASSLELRKEMSTISPFILESFFECFLIKVSVEKLTADKTLQFTLFTRLLCCAPQDMSFRFICNVLRDFPYIQGKYLIIGILKQLFTTKFPKQTTGESKEFAAIKDNKSKEDDLAAHLSKLKIDDSDLVTTKFIDLTLKKMSELTKIISAALKSGEISHQPSIHPKSPNKSKTHSPTPRLRRSVSSKSPQSTKK